MTRGLSHYGAALFFSLLPFEQNVCNSVRNSVRKIRSLLAISFSLREGVPPTNRESQTLDI